MRHPRSIALLICILAASLHADPLAVYDRGEWQTWWRSEAAPVSWKAADPTMSRAVKWSPVQAGLEMAEVRLAASAPALRILLIAIRIDPEQFEFRLIRKRQDDGQPGWQVGSAPANVAFAFNAGQFANGKPWGWVIHDREELQPPASGPLSMALVVDSAQRAHLVPYREIDSVRRANTDQKIVMAFQTYPVLLEDGVIPSALLAEDRGVDLRHRDSRLAVGILRDGRLLLVLTRFDIGGGALRAVPIGPNTPEMAAIMGGLGCSTAVMLDGGISSQLLVRGKGAWPAYRRVPLGIVGIPKAH